MKYLKNKYILNIDQLEQLREIYIYGTGVSSNKFKALVDLKNINIKILGFIDSYKKSTIDNEVKTYNVCDFDDKNKAIIICTYYEVWIDEIINILSKKNINNYFINMIILDPMYHLNEKMYTFYANKILFARKKFSDMIDIKIWDSIIAALQDNLNNTNLFDNYYQHGNEQYLDCFQVDKNDIVIEGGIFDGTTSLKIANYLVDGKLYAFDPLISNEKNGLLANPKIKIYKKALWDKHTILYFIHNGAGSYVLEKKPIELSFNNNYDEILSETVDNFISQNNLQKFDFLKLDVEGAELNVLFGAIKSIKRYRPKLAISIYHSLEDFFIIPFYLMTELEDYNFHIRLYSGALMDTVLYAIPKKIQHIYDCNSTIYKKRDIK